MHIVRIAVLAAVLTALAGPAFADCRSSTQATVDAMTAAGNASSASTSYVHANTQNKGYCTAQGHSLMSAQDDALARAESLALDTRKVCEAEGQPLSDIDYAISSIRTNKSTHEVMKTMFEFCN